MQRLQTPWYAIVGKFSGGIALALTLISAVAAKAETWSVTSSADNVTQKHTLRYAIAHAQSGDTILLTAAIKDPIVLTKGELIVSQNVTILSVPPRTPTISGNGASRVFEISAGANVTLQNLNLTNGLGQANNPDGSASEDGNGGAILNLGTLTVQACTLSGNFSLIGGGIYNLCMLTVTDSTIQDNTAVFNAGGILNDVDCTMDLTNTAITGNTSYSSGGGVSTHGAATITGGSIHDNTAASGGGAIYSYLGSLAISGITIQNNTAGGDGGGIHTSSAIVTVTNCTIKDNRANGDGILNGSGGAIFNYSTDLTVSGSTLSGNSASLTGGGISNGSWDGVATLTVSGCTLSNNSSKYGGGIFNWVSCLASITGSELSGNSAIKWGGGAVNYNGVLGVGTSDFSSNDPDQIPDWSAYTDLGGNSGL